MSTTEDMRNPNEAREVSILKRNLRLLKRLTLGKKKPPVLLLYRCLGFLFWDLLMIIGFLFIGFGGSVMDAFDSSSNSMDELTPRYFYTYAVLHIVSLIGVILMYRRRLVGFYLFAGANILMPFWVYVITQNWKFEPWVLIFSVISIALFGLNWNKFIANIKKKEKRAAEQ